MMTSKNNKKEFVQESKARNNTFHRKGKNNARLLPNKEKNSNHTRTNRLPKLKSSSKPENKGNSTSTQHQSKGINPGFKKHTKKQPEKYASIRSSGYGGGSSAAPNAKSKAATKLPSLNEKQPNHSYGYSKRTNNARQLPPLNRGFR